MLSSAISNRARSPERDFGQSDSVGQLAWTFQSRNLILKIDDDSATCELLNGCVWTRRRKKKTLRLDTAARRRDRRAVRVQHDRVIRVGFGRGPARLGNVISLPFSSPARVLTLVRLPSVCSVSTLLLCWRAATGSKEGCSRRRRWCVCVSRVIAARSILYIRATTVRRRTVPAAGEGALRVGVFGRRDEGESGARTRGKYHVFRVYGMLPYPPSTRPSSPYVR